MQNRQPKRENLITADDDILAVLSRELITNELIGSRLVNYESNTLSDSTHYFTTLATIYECTKRILEASFGKISDQSLPDSATQTLYRESAREYWERLLGGVTIFHSALVNKGGRRGRSTKRNKEDTLVGKASRSTDVDERGYTP